MEIAKIPPLKQTDVIGNRKRYSQHVSVTTHEFIEENSLTADREHIIELLSNSPYQKERDIEGIGALRKEVFGRQTRRFILGMGAGERFLSIYYGRLFYYEAGVYADSNYECLEISAVLARNKGKLRHPYIPHSTQLFGIALQYFQKQGHIIKAVTGSWSARFDHMENINYRIYAEKLAEGFDPEKAALLTPQGKIMSKFGFSKVVFEPVDPRIIRKEAGVDLMFYRH